MFNFQFGFRRAAVPQGRFGFIARWGALVSADVSADTVAMAAFLLAVDKRSSCLSRCAETQLCDRDYGQAEKLTVLMWQIVQ